ncbi:MAG: hypothetical protein M1826_000518 [Phylliscum demangeonii]|nr:MAG: hypothetical protein M1826_000518 [Phylliscum demangeonii]
MSDEDDFMQESDPDQYDFEYEEDEGEESGDVDIENKYYNAKQIKSAEPETAVEDFLGLAAMESEKGEWGFKGLKQAVKLEYKLKKYDKAIEHFRELLTYVKSAVTRNYSEKSVNNMLAYVEKGADDEASRQCLETIYSTTLESFQEMNNERLWLKTNTRLARLMLERGEFEAVQRKFRDLHQACELPDGSDDPNKANYVMEIYALEIQMYSDQKNNKRLKSLYQRALKLRSAVPHPKVMGVIRECGGKMHMSEGNWPEAQSDFFESFRNYDEAGSLQRIQVLKYLLLSTMLMRSSINPFDSQETKPYRNDSRIAAMNDLMNAYQHSDIRAYQSVLERSPDLFDDSFIAENIGEVTRNMRTNAMLKMIWPYSSFRLASVAAHLRIPVAEAEDLLCFLVTDGRIRAKICQTDGTVVVERAKGVARLDAIREWCSSLDKLSTHVFEFGDGYQPAAFGAGSGAYAAASLAGTGGEEM